MVEETLKWEKSSNRILAGEVLRLTMRDKSPFDTAASELGGGQELKTASKPNQQSAVEDLSDHTKF